MEKIINKIRKLTALAERAGSEAEAETAMSLVHELLTKYNISIADIKSTGDTEYEQRVFRETYGQAWVRIIYAAISSLYFCRCFYNTSEGRQNISVVGRPLNVETVKYIMEVVLRTANRQAREYAHQPTIRTSNRRNALNSFKKGYGVRIAQRCYAMIEEAKSQDFQGSEAGSALVVANYYKSEEIAINAWLERERGIKALKAARLNFGGDLESMRAGEKAANNVNLRNSGLPQDVVSKFLIGGA